MDTKGELAVGRPWAAKELNTADQSEAANTEMAPVTVLKPFDHSPLKAEIANIQT
jgi:hypothetical protein